MTDPTTFETKPWPGEGPPRDHNLPPLDERVLQDFDLALAKLDLPTRIRAITETADGIEAVDSPERAGDVGDLLVLARTAKAKVEAERETLNRPLLTAQRALKAKADSMVAPMDSAIAAVRRRLDEFMAGQEEAALGDLGSRVGTKTEWRFEISDYAKALKQVQQHETVRDAVAKAIGAMVRGGQHEIPGVKIWSEQRASVR